jgi:hypothetical protein
MFSLLLLSFVFSGIFLKRNSVDMEVPSGRQVNDNAGRNYDSFLVENVSMVKKKDNNILFSLTAGEIVHRKRESKLFVYQNIKEILISGATIDIFLDNEASLANSNNNLLLTDNLKTIFTSFGKPASSIEDYLNGKVADSDLDIMSRIVFKDITLNMHFPNGRRISIVSKNAVVNADLENIVFTDFVRIIDSNSGELSSAKAIWSKKYSQFYFPEGYSFNKKTCKAKASYALSQEGEFIKLLTVMPLYYLDLLDKSENSFYSKVLKKVPPEIKMMLGYPAFQQ